MKETGWHPRLVKVINLTAVLGFRLEWVKYLQLIAVGPCVGFRLWVALRA